MVTHVYYSAILDLAHHAPKWLVIAATVGKRNLSLGVVVLRSGPVVRHVVTCLVVVSILVKNLVILDHVSRVHARVVKAATVGHLSSLGIVLSQNGSVKRYVVKNIHADIITVKKFAMVVHVGSVQLVESVNVLVAKPNIPFRAQRKYRPVVTPVIN